MTIKEFSFGFNAQPRLKTVKNSICEFSKQFFEGSFRKFAYKHGHSWLFS